MATNIDDIIKKANADSNLDFEFPRCTTRWCTSNLPATKSIPFDPTKPNLRRSVCENCYYDYEYEGIWIYSWRD